MAPTYCTYGARVPASGRHQIVRVLRTVALQVLRIAPNASADRRKFEDVPVVWVRDWAELTPRFLRGLG